MDATDSRTREVDLAPDAAASDAATSPAAPAQAEVPPGSWLTVLRTSHPALQGLYAFASYLAVFIAVYARPVAHHLNVPDLRQYWTDPNFYLWSMRWWPYAVSHGINPLFSHEIGAPHGYSLAWASTTPSVDLAMWPVTAAFGVVVSYNIMLLAIPPVSGWAAFVATRRLTGRFWPSLLAGAVYGFCPYEIVHTWQGQPNLTVMGLFPLMVYLILLWWDRALKNTWFAICMALAMTLEFYTFNEAFFDMTVVLAGGLVIGFAVAGRAARGKVARLAGLIAVAYAGAVILSAPYLYYALKHNSGTLVRGGSEYSLDMVRLILPWTDKVFGLAPLVSYTSNVGRGGLDDYVGLPLLLVLLGVAVLGWRSRIIRLLVLGFVFVIALAAGPDLTVGSVNIVPLPWGWLWNLPIARSAEQSRFIVFAVLLLAVALALWLAAPAGSKPLRGARWALALLALAAVMVDSPTAHEAVNPAPQGYAAAPHTKPVNQLPAFITGGMYRRYLRPGETVVIVTRRGNAGMLFQATADFYFRIAGGFINASLTRQNALPHPITLAAHPSKVADQLFKDYLRTSGVGAIIVEQAWESPWMQNFSTRLHMHGTPVGGVIIYPTAPWLASQAHAAATAPRQQHPRKH